MCRRLRDALLQEPWQGILGRAAAALIQIEEASEDEPYRSSLHSSWLPVHRHYLTILTAKVVSAYVAGEPVAVLEVPNAIRSVHQAFSQIATASAQTLLRQKLSLGFPFEPHDGAHRPQRPLC
jgi:hypothetical protein